MTDDKFISPTMDWAYARDPNWVTDPEALYKMGFSKRTMVDAYGFDAYGFNEHGIDRLGCTEADYRDPLILALGKTSGEWMSLSQKLPIPLPRFWKLAPMMERLCTSRWDVEQKWVAGVENLPRDGAVRLYTNMGPDFSIGLHWYDLDDRKDNYLTLKTDVIAKLDVTDDERDIYFRIVSCGQGSGYQLVENPLCVSSISDAFQAVKKHIDEHMQPLHAWHIRVVDTPDGPALAAYSTAEKDDTVGDAFAEAVVARTKEDALQIVLDNAKTSSVASMASAGISKLIGHPAVVRGPRR
ncbi:hypothetical protein OIU34_23450 [Pararhizobium sp. BT-229]|uniref:hypothetical protein n=1 Tax=Pararhizobium sp. BT-229 TaxID=2986923 RepID=UPI0021F6E5EC|nr:hypothetical protein [Pararhizobium sp. BT-229]MCV9964853.1 hypothetical protein [Pararhizobium sp. BT-229]